MTTHLLAGLAGIVGSLEFHSADCFSTLGRRYNGGPQSAKPAPGSFLNADALAALAMLLYETLHCRVGAMDGSETPDPLEKRIFAARLSDANSGTGPWQGDWTVVGIHPDGRLIVSKDRITIWAHPTQFRAQTDACPGTIGELKMPSEYRRMYPGFYAALGDAEAGGFPNAVRLYWHLVPSVAERFVEFVTRALNRAGLPFQLKILDDPTSYRRTDAAVLYLPRETLGDAAELLAAIHREFKRYCRPDTSHYCLRLADGVGLAEDPGDPKTSFGLHRSHLLASILATPDTAGAAPADRIAVVMEQLKARQFDAERFYLNPGSPDIRFRLTDAVDS